MACCDITLGMFKTAINVVRYNISTSPTGNPQPSTQTNVSSFKCMWEVLSTAKVLMGLKLGMHANIKVVCRWNANIHNNDKIVYNGVLHDIKSIRRINGSNKPDLYGRYMEILLLGGDVPQVNMT